MSILDKPVGSMSVGELQRLIDRRITANTPAVPTQVAKLADLDFPLVAPDVPTDDTVLQWDGTRVKAIKVSAALLEAVMVLASTIVAGDPNGAHVEMGIDQGDITSTGFRAFNSALSETFDINAQDGSVFMKGRLDWGTASRLLNNDILEMAKQATTGFQIPARVQAANISESQFGGSDFTSIACKWPSPTTKGNLLLAVVTQLNSGGGTAPGTPTISGWTQMQTVTVGTGPVLRQTIFKIENSASHSGNETISLVSNTRYAAVQFFEYSGVDVVDVVTTAMTGLGTGASTSSTGVLAQAGELLFGAVSSPNVTASSPSSGFSIAGQAAAVHNHGSHPILNVIDVGQTCVELITTSTASTSTTLALGSMQLAAAQLVTFKAKALGVGSPDTGLLREYAKIDGSSTPVLHVQNDAGVENSLAMAPAGKGYRMEYVTAAVNWPSTAAHTAATDQTPSIGGLLVGDLCFIIGLTSGTAPIPKAFIAYTEGVCTTNGQIAVHGFNADSVVVDPASTTYHFLVIHIT